MPVILQGHVKAGANPSWVRGGVNPGQVTSPSQSYKKKLRLLNEKTFTPSSGAREFESLARNPREQDWPCLLGGKDGVILSQVNQNDSESAILIICDRSVKREVSIFFPAFICNWIHMLLLSCNLQGNHSPIIISTLLDIL